MIDLTRRDSDKARRVPDEEVVFVDGFLFVITQTYYIGEDNIQKVKYDIKVKCLNIEFDEPITLKDIETRYPNVHKVIYEDWLGGDIYNYGNHRGDPKAENWELVGHTIGFA